MGRIYDATWGRLFAAAYDRGLKATEEAGLRRMRADLLAGARGRVVEIGAGTGVNLDLYPAAIEKLALVEPDPHMARRLQTKVAASPREAEIVEAPAERLPYGDDSFDTAIATLVFCTIPEPAAALDELARVLRPGGQLLFVEHVRSRHPRLAAWQDRLEKPWQFLGDGCHCNRDTLATIAASSFRLGEVEHGRLPKAPPIVRPLVRGSAVLSS
ncbi:MAG TPA: class I SAM-dependent methyltransferase [Solirubrobacterales bacterium]|jgi:ubiquinone/menaquinone biosynthesis C-methylase UbiE|nr:class I SAM-dependent methyltransferase [Solirubrobacterales bacterium]